jgi:hypothetical protein
MISRWWLDIVDVNSGTGYAAGSQRRDQVGFDHYWPSRRID